MPPPPQNPYLQWAGTVLQQCAREAAKCTGEFSAQYARRIASLADAASAVQEPGGPRGTTAGPCFPDGTYSATAAFASWLAAASNAGVNSLAGTAIGSAEPPVAGDLRSKWVMGPVEAPAGTPSRVRPAGTLLEAAKNHGLPFEGLLAETLARLLDAGQWRAVRGLDLARRAMPNQETQPSEDQKERAPLGEPLGTDMHDQYVGGQAPAGQTGPLLFIGRDEEGMKVEGKEGDSSPLGIEPSPPSSIRRMEQEDTSQSHPSGPCLMAVAVCLSEFWDAVETLETVETQEEGGDDGPFLGVAPMEGPDQVRVFLCWSSANPWRWMVFYDQLGPWTLRCTAVLPKLKDAVCRAAVQERVQHAVLLFQLSMIHAEQCRLCKFLYVFCLLLQNLINTNTSQLVLPSVPFLLLSFKKKKMKVLLHGPTWIFVRD